MSVLNKITVERNQKTLLELVAKPGNDICADCKARNPRWASHSLGIFICVNCASIHRKIGTHVTKVKSLTMDMWSKEQVENMRSMGNANSNAIHNPNEVRHPPPANLMDAERDSELEQYIRSKYEFKRFMDKSALVSSKLGPTRSVTSVTSSGSSRSASSPLASAPPPSARPSTTTPSSQIPPKRPFAVTTPVAPTRSASQSLTTTQPLSQQPPQKPPPQTNGVDNPKGVWADLVSLQAPPSSSSLPLQFQMTSQTPISAQQGAFTGTIGSYQSSMGTGINPYQQQQHLASNPYSQQLYQTPGMQTSQFSSTAPYSPSTLTPQQPFFSNQAQMPPMSAPGAPGQNNFFHPQPQQGALQIQVPNAAHAMFATGNGQGSFMSAPATQGQFLSSSPGQQFQSHSPQPMMSGTPQSQMLSTTPQPHMMMGQPGQFMSPSPQLQQPHQQQQQPQQQMGMGMEMAGMQQGQFHSMQGQMQMHPQQQQQQGFYGAGASQPQMNMQQQDHFGGYQGQPYSAGGFAGGQQWGAM